MPVEHPIEPLYDSRSRILILGSFPSVKSREVGFYYGHPQNRFWKVISAVSGKELPISIEEKKTLLHELNIAVWDVIRSCTISGSSDSSISDVVPNDLSVILDNSRVAVIYINGRKAYELYQKYIYPDLIRRYGRTANAVLLPSTSPANAAWRLDQLVNAWSRIKTGLSVKPGPYYSLNDYCRNTYGHKLYKLSLDGGFTCPNRDGRLGYGGCIFCDGDGSGAFAGSAGSGKASDITAQLSYQKKLIAGKLPKSDKYGYIAYFQAYTGTYDRPERLRKLYMEAVKDPEVEIISVATRPDCIDRDIADLLKEIDEIKPVWIELGLQTVNPGTAEYIRRGYDLKVYDKAVTMLQKTGISQIITHVILGLPGESKKDMLDTVKYVAASPSNGIKLQLLHVLKGTDLAVDYEEGRFNVLTMEEYIDILKACIEILPPDMVVHRLTGDGDRQKLIAPMWSADKKKTLNAIQAELKKDSCP